MRLYFLQSAWWLSIAAAGIEAFLAAEGHLHRGGPSLHRKVYWFAAPRGQISMRGPEPQQDMELEGNSSFAKAARRYPVPTRGSAPLKRKQLAKDQLSQARTNSQAVSLRGPLAEAYEDSPSLGSRSPSFAIFQGSREEEIQAPSQGTPATHASSPGGG